MKKIIFRNFNILVRIALLVCIFVISVQTAWAAFYSISTTDSSIVDWTGIVPDPYLTDPNEGIFPIRSSIDILNAWVAADGGTGTDYIYFRVETETTAVNGANDEVGVVIDCNNNDNFFEPTDLMLLYNGPADQVYYHSDPSTGPNPYGHDGLLGTTTDGQAFGTNVEWRAQKSALVGLGCTNATAGDIRFLFMAQTTDGNPNNNEFTANGGPWNSPTAISLQNANTSLVIPDFSFGIILVLMAGLMTVTWFQIRRSRIDTV